MPELTPTPRSAAQPDSPRAPNAWIAGPQHYGDPAAEFRAAQNDAAMFDLNGRAHLVLIGKDRAKFLHGFCTNSITTLRPGESCEAFATNIKGRILDHLFILAEESAIRIDATAGGEDRLFAHLDRYIIAEDVQIERESSNVGQFLIGGPNAAIRLASLGVTEAASLAPDTHQTVTIAGRKVVLWRSELLGTPGYRLLLAREDLEAVRTAFVGAGIVPAGAATFEPLRIAAGIPSYGVDLTDDNLAQEAMRTPRAISFKKGCYLGQEPIARIDAIGHINRQLAGLRLESTDVPSPGEKVTTPEGREVGTITSAALAPGASQSVALAMLKSQAAQPGTSLRAGATAATVSAW